VSEPVPGGGASERGAGEPLGLIAGNGRFPFLAAAGARRAGRRVVALAIREEADPGLKPEVAELHWIGLGQLGRGIEILRGAGAREAIMAGQVKHRQIFSGIVPDLKLLGVLARLAFQNTDSLIGAVADALAREGITLLPSVAFLADHLAGAGVMSRRRPDREERRDVAYGETVARAIAGLDLGQTAVVKHRAAVALEAMEGTDETIRRAGRIAGPGTTVVKVSKPRQDMRFDVPVVGPGTLAAMREAGSRVLAVDAGRTLLIDRPELLARADADGVAVVGLDPERREASDG
jgi:UDP-2,3-diacylglucosamine hydrolase